MTFRDLLFGIAGGIRDDGKIKFFIPGGASSQWLIGSDEHLDAPLDMDFVQQTFGVMLGSGAVMVFDETVDPRARRVAAREVLRARVVRQVHAVPRGHGLDREGLYRMSHGLGRPDDLDLLFDVGDNISPGVMNAPFIQTTICPLGPSAVSAIASLHKYFRDEIEARVRRRSARDDDRTRDRSKTTSPSPSTARRSTPQPGELLIKAAQEHGIYIPRFCWHERMKPVGMCRMCLVEVDGVRGFPPACTTPVADGMVVHTPERRGARRSRTASSSSCSSTTRSTARCATAAASARCRTKRSRSGPASRGSSRRSATSRSRSRSAISCCSTASAASSARAAPRFADEIAGDPLIDFVDRGDRTQVLNFAEQPFDSYFSGNTVQICPVGALTASQYRFRARPWDLATVETSCTTCAVQCRGAVQSSSNRLGAPARCRLRARQPRLAVRQGPLRHRVGALRQARPRAAAYARTASSREVSWPEALDAAADDIRKREASSTAPARSPCSAARAARTRTRTLWALPREGRDRHRQRRRAARRRPARRDRARHAARRDRRLRPRERDRAARPRSRRGAPGAAPARARARSSSSAFRSSISRRSRTGCPPHAAVVARAVPGEPLAAARARRRSSDVREGRDGPVVVIVGPRQPRRRARTRPSPRPPSSRGSRRQVPLGAAARQRARRARRRARTGIPARPGHARRRSRLVHEAVGRRAEGTRPRCRGHPAGRGRRQDRRARASRRRSDVPTSPTRRSRADALEGGADDRSRSTRSSPTRPSAPTCSCPCTLWGEKSGTVTNIEGRVQRVGRKVAPEGTAMDDWRIAVELALRLGSDIDLATVDEVTDEIAAVAPAFAGVTRRRSCARARDGVVLPLRDHADEIVLRTARADDHGRRRFRHVSWDPIKVEGGAAAEGDSPTCRGRRQPRPSPRRTRPRCTSGTASAANTEAPASRRVRSAPRGGPHALRQAGASSRDRRRLQRIVRANRRSAVNPTDAARIGVELRAARSSVTSARGSQTVAVEPDPAFPPASRRFDFTADGAGPALLIDATAPVTDLRVESRAVTHVLALDPLFDSRHRRWSVLRRRADQGRRRVRDPARRGDALHLGDAQGHRRHAEPHRTQPRRPVRRAADARRRHQALLQGAVDPRLGRPAGVPARAVPVDPARVPAVLHRADRRHGVDPRAHDLPAGRRPPDRRAVHPRDVGHRRVRRDARGLGVGFEVPAARLGARVGAAALVRSRVRARDPRRVDPGEHAVDARDRRRSRAGTSWHVDLRRQLVLAADVRRVRHLPDRGDRRGRTTRRSTSSRPSRSSSAGSTPSTPASGSRSSSSPSS